MDIAQIITLLESPVPRYTSYPTANHFQKTLSSTAYEQYVSVIDSKVSLYFHIPFCKSLCTYCGCFTRIPNEYEKVLPYVDALIKEIKLVTQKASKKLHVKHIHFGGGTPTYLAKNDLAKIFTAINESFTIDTKAEIAIEIDPRTVELETMQLLKDFGVNRVSLGVQDLNDDVQKAINRIQPFDVVMRSVKMIRKVGIKAMNFDLMYGLPLQTTEKIINTMKNILLLEPNRIAYFGYAHTPWMRSHQKQLEIYELPNAKERYEQFIYGRNYLISHGYCHIGLDHFAQESDSMTKAYLNRSLRRNFQGYTTDTSLALLGFGVSAISAFKKGFFQNTLEILGYKKQIADGKLPIRKECFLSQEDAIRQRVISDLMCFNNVDLKSICGKYYQSIYTLAKSKLLVLQEKKLLIIEQDCHIHITEYGKPLVRLIASCFDTYLESNLLHAQTV